MFPSFREYRQVSCIDERKKGREDFIMQNFVRKPSVDLFPGIKVYKDTVLEYENENVKQKLENLVLHSVQKTKGEKFESENHITIYLEEGDILLFEDEGRGYIMPVNGFVTIEEAIDDLTNIKDLG